MRPQRPHTVRTAFAPLLALSMLLGACMSAPTATSVPDTGATQGRVERVAAPRASASSVANGIVTSATDGSAPAVHVPMGAYPLLDTGSVHDVAVASDVVYVGSSGGLIVVEGDMVREHWTVADGLLSHQIKALLYDDAHHTLWIAFAEGGCQRLLAGNRLVACPSELQRQVVTGWARHDGATLALTWDGALHRISQAQSTVSTVLPAGAFPYASRVVSCGSQLWLGSRGRGAGKIDGSQVVTERGPRIIDDLACMEGVPVAVGPEGIYRYDGAWLPIAYDASNGRPTSLGVSADGLVVGWSSGRVARLDQEGTTPVEVDGVPKRILADDDRLLIVTSEGLETVEGGTEEPRRVSLIGPGGHDIAALAADQEMLAVAYFRDGITLLANGLRTRVSTETGLPTNEINAVTFAPDGALWAATSRGLVSIARSGEVTATLGVEELGCWHVNDVHITERGLVVAASCGVGLVDMEHREVERWWGTADGLPHRIVYTAAVWRDALVVGTNDGLAWRPLSSPHDERWTRVRAAPGRFEDNWVTALEVDGSDRLVVGTYSGGLFRGDLDAMQAVQGPHFVNLNAVMRVGDRLVVGGLSEGAWVVSEAGARAMQASCLPGADVTAMVSLQGDVVLASRSGAWTLPQGCL